MSLEPYRATRPAPRSIRSSWHILSAALKRLGYFLVHTLRSYELRSTAPPGLSQQSPSGTISAEQLKMCERLASQAAERIARVEQKATNLLSVIALLAPLSASAAVFIVLNLPSQAARAWVLGVESASICFLLLASIAVMRALAVRVDEDIGMGGVIDQGTIREYSVDFEGRGLLYVVAIRDAIADHVADFVRAAQVFLWIGIAAQVIAGTFILALARERPNQIEGTVDLTPTTIRALVAAYREDDLTTRLDSLARDVLRTQRALDQVKARFAEPRQPKGTSRDGRPRE